MTAGAYIIAFEPVEERHLALLRSWIERPHVRQWWGEPEVEIAMIRDMVEGRDSTRPYIVVVNGEPAGYIQCWFIGHWQNEPWIADNPWLGELPKDAIGVDITIGREDLLSKGIGSRALRQFVDGLRSQGYHTIIIDPDSENHRAVRAYEKAGFRVLPELLGRSGNSLIMKHEDRMDSA